MSQTNGDPVPTRTVSDALGPLEVPSDSYYGANNSTGGRKLPVLSFAVLAQIHLGSCAHQVRGSQGEPRSRYPRS